MKSEQRNAHLLVGGAIGGAVLVVLALFVAAYYAGGWALDFILKGG